ncbi:aldo/keto reductase, partial [bacterium]|nr:aldo/keto reductase [bacterium]
AVQKSCTLAQLALAWILMQGKNIVAIPGTTRKANFEENLHALDVLLDSNEVERINEIMQPDAIAGPRYNKVMMNLVDQSN